MIEWIVAIGIMLFCSVVISPKRISHVWLCSLIPLCIATIYILTLSWSSSNYMAGLAIAKLLYPVVVTGVMIFFLLRKKLKEGKIGKQILFTSIIISLLLATPIFITSFLERDIKNSLRLTNKENKSPAGINKAIIQEEESQRDEAITTFNKYGLTFQHENKWNIISEVLEPELAFQVSGSNILDDNDSFNIYWIKSKDVYTPNSWVREMTEELQKTDVFKNAIFLDRLISETDTGYTSFTIINISVNSAGKAVNNNLYGEIISYYVGENIILIYKQAANRAYLKTYLKLIEESIEFND